MRVLIPLALPFILPASLIAQAPDVCRVMSGPSRLPGLMEASGVTASRRTPGLLWTMNDSGKAQVIAIDAASGATRGAVTISGARVDDWEDVTAAPCSIGRADGPCLYIGDIGDNQRTRRTITIYRVAEPVPGEPQTRPVEAITARYPDGAHDAEAMFAMPNGDLFVITKDRRATALYRLDAAAARGAARLERMRTLPLTLVTDADLSPDARWVAVRSNEDLFFYPAADLVAGRAVDPQHVSLTRLNEPQGEGVTFGPNGDVYLVGEGSRGGTFATLACTLPGR
jgi:hypothetical protein